LGLKPIRTTACTPQSNGKVERLIKAVLEDWVHVIAYQASEERNLWLPCCLGIDNGSRCHMALSGLSPQQRLMRLLAAE
jgi:hypothetical protein